MPGTGDHPRPGRECVLREGPCTSCLECLYCDVDPYKECDNCMACVADEADFRAILVDDILLLQERVFGVGKAENRTGDRNDDRNEHSDRPCHPHRDHQSGNDPGEDS